MRVWMIDYIDGGNLFRNLKFLFPFFRLSFFNCTHLKSFLSLFLLSHRLFLGSTFLSFTARSLAVPHLNLLPQLSAVLRLISSILFALCFSPSLSYSLSLLLSVSLILSHCFYLYLSLTRMHSHSHSLFFRFSFPSFRWDYWSTSQSQKASQFYPIREGFRIRIRIRRERCQSIPKKIC